MHAPPVHQSQMACTAYTSKLVLCPSRSHCSHSREKLLSDAMRLPVWQAKANLLELVRANNAVVIVGETGSGKTTQIPQFLLKAGFANGGAIAVTQPRRYVVLSWFSSCLHDITGCRSLIYSWALYAQKS